MKFNKDAPRYRASHGELIGGTGGITRMCPAGDFLEVYKIDKTFRIYPPEVLDPKEVDPNMPWMSKPVSDVGSANCIVARVFIQFSEAIKNTPLKDGVNKDDILRCMHRCKELLLICTERHVSINNEVERICDMIRKKELKSKSRHFGGFPQVEKLEERCAEFLSNAKNVIQTLAELINVFYKTTFDGPRFDKIVKWAEINLQQNKQFLLYLKKIAPDIKNIADFRNAQEHPKRRKKLKIENFTIKPGGVVYVPIWYISDEKPTDIHHSMKAIAKFLMDISEGIFLYCVMDNIRSSLSFIVRAVDDTALDHQCPIKYFVEPDLRAFSSKRK
jgi:hypothetical protein